MNVAFDPRRQAALKAPAVEPLIDAQSAYPAIERAILTARTSVRASFRIFDPDSRPVSDEARRAGLHTWGELVADAVARGVDVRIALADFDPVVMTGLHRTAWRSLAGFGEAVATWRRSEEPRGRAEIIAVPHEGEVGAALRMLFWPVAWFKIRKLLGELEDGDDLSHAPGLKPYVRRNGHGLAVRPWPPIRLWPASHHQKVLVVDGETAFVGGLDIDDRRFDTHDHDRPAPTTWHDVMVRLEGAPARDVDRWFVSHWNHEVPRFATLSRERGIGIPAALDGPTRLPPVQEPVEEPVEALFRLAAEPGNGAGEEDGRRVDLVVTRSSRSRSPFAIGPKPQERRIEDAYLDLVAGAEDLLYVETQFFRDPVLTDALVRRARQARDLHLLMVLPPAPEDVAFYDDHGLSMRHGEWLQTRALEEVKAAFGPRCGLFTLATRRPREEESERDSVFGAGAIYVHAKIAVADDREAIVSSANLNPRSMNWDTEVGVAWRDRRSASSLRRRLFASHLGDAAAGAPADGAGALALWRRVALDNVLLEPPERTGQILPFPLEQTRRFARRAPFFPAELL